MQQRFLTIAALLAALGSPLSSQDSSAAGYGVADLAVGPPQLPGGPFGLTVFGVARTLSNGDVVTFDGQVVRRLDERGALVATLGSLPSINFTGCIAIDPTESHAIVGESSLGDVYRVELDGSGMSLLANLPFNFDAVFEAPGSVLVSANKTMSFADNHIVRLDTTTGATSDVCFVSSASGPVALDAAGNLYYGLLGAPASVIVWTAAQIQGGTLLGEADAITLASGFAGTSSLAVDPGSGAVFLAENDFGTGANRIVQVLVSAGSSPEILTGTTLFNNLGGLEFVPSDCGGAFAGWQPACGGTLRYSAIDFVSLAYRAEVTPARAEASLTGPGAGVGPGRVAFEISGGPANGLAQVFFGSTSSYATPEVAYGFPGAPPLFTGLSLGAIDLLGGVLPLDGSGELSLAGYDPGLDGLITMQALCFDGSLVAYGTTTAAHL